VIVTPRSDLLRWSRYLPGRAKLVFDMVDSYLDIPRTNVKMLLRGPAKFAAREAATPFFSYRRAIERILKRADAATCAAPEQTRAISRFCANAHPILDFESMLITTVKDDYTTGTPLNLVWEGLGENARWFSEIRRPLAEVARERPVVLNLITQPTYKQIMQRFWTRETAKVVARSFDEVRVHPWREAAAGSVATGCDIALIPLPLDRPLERGKPESKLIIFWLMGLPTVTSSTPAYMRVMAAAGQQLHCSSERDWTEALLRLAADEKAREAAGRDGRAFAEREYGDERLMQAWDRLFDSL
jgi:hypothetical protein